MEKIGFPFFKSVETVEGINHYINSILIASEIEQFSEKSFLDRMKKSFGTKK